MTLLKYLLTHASLIALGVAGEIYHIPWAWNAFAFVIWAMVVIATLIASGPKESRAHVRAKINGVPKWLDYGVDFAICMSLAATAHFWMAGFYLWQLACSQLIREEKESNSNENP